MGRLKIIGAATTIVAAWIGAGLSVVQFLEGREDRQFDNAMTLKDKKTESFKAQIAAYDGLQDKSGREAVILQQLHFESAWRDERDLQELLRPTLERGIAQMPAEQQSRISMILARNRDNDQFNPAAIALGAAYLLIHDDSSASEYLTLAQANGDDPPASALLALAQSRLSRQAPTPQERQSFQRSALQSFQQAVQVAGWTPNQDWSLGLIKDDKSKDDKRKDAVRDLATITFSDKALHEVVKDDPAYKALIESWRAEGHQEAMLVPQGGIPESYQQ